MIIDLHVHTNSGSDDSIIEPGELVRLAREAGIDGVCITEHGNIKSRLAEELSRESGFLVLAGIEASTDLGDILVFGIDSYPRHIYRAIDLKRIVEQAGGVMVAAHPFRNLSAEKLWRGQDLTVEEVYHHRLFSLVDAIEVVNGWCSEGEVNLGHQVSMRLGIRGTGGSDAHFLWQIGWGVTVFGNSIRNERELITELKRGNFKAEDRRTAEERKNPLCHFIPLIRQTF